MKNIKNDVITIFGATGSLAQKKLFPALYSLFLNSKLSSNIKIIGVGRSSFAEGEFNNIVEKSLNDKKDSVSDFCQKISYITINPENSDDYDKLKKHIKEISPDANNLLFHIATPPSAYTHIITNLAKNGLSRENRDSKKIIIEKPFGHDLESAKSLNKILLKNFNEKQIYRIDHYLGKETVQNLLVFRFSNAIFEPLWNRNYIDYVEISCAEGLGIENRASYYEKAGATSDMLQSHLLQLLAIVAMEPPACFTADSIRNENVKVIQCLKPLSEDDLKQNLVLGQYTQSLINGKILKGYHQEKDVREDSNTETYVALKTYINNWRWNGVPFYLRTGKRMPTKVTELVIHFKNTPHPVFGVNPPDNKLIIRIEPNEGILIQFGMKKPGPKFNSKKVEMDFHYKDLGNIELPSAYERLLIDAIEGDATLYTRTDTVEKCWEFVEPILKYRKDSDCIVHPYPCGSWGPIQSDILTRNDGRNWRYPCKNLVNGEEFCEL